LHIAACHLLEFEISGYVGRDEDVGQLSAGHEELGYEIDIPVVYAAILLPWLLALVIVAILLEELRDVRWAFAEISRWTTRKRKRGDLQSRY